MPPPTARTPDAIGAGITGPVGRVIDWVKAHPTLTDGLVAVTIFAIALPSLMAPDPAVFPDDVRDGDPLGILLLAGMTLPLTWRRRRPDVVLLVILAALLPFLVLNYADSTGTLAGIIAVYSLAAHVERRQALRIAAAAFVPFVVILVAGVFHESERLPPGALLTTVFTYWGAFGIGDAFRSRRAYVGELQLRLDTAEQLRQEEAAMAAAAERARIARELHDVVAHGMSVMVVQAAAARRVLDKHPDQAAEALDHIERTGRESLAEMRRLLGVLRDEADALTRPEPGGAPPVAAADLAPQPGLGSLDALVASWSEAGMPVRLEVRHDARGPSTLPAGADLAAYRIVQEALTNVAKHAGPVTDVVVRVARSSDVIRLEVVDDGRGAASGADSDVARDVGYGLLGMAERAALYGGVVESGPNPGGGWRVRARVGAGRDESASDDESTVRA